MGLYTKAQSRLAILSFPSTHVRPVDECSASSRCLFNRDRKMSMLRRKSGSEASKTDSSLPFFSVMISFKLCAIFLYVCESIEFIDKSRSCVSDEIYFVSQSKSSMMRMQNICEQMGDPKNPKWCKIIRTAVVRVVPRVSLCVPFLFALPDR